MTTIIIILAIILVGNLFYDFHQAFCSSKRGKLARVIVDAVTLIIFAMLAQYL